MIKNKKVLFVTTTDNMIWQFLLPHIKHLEEMNNVVECACARTGFWFEELQEMGVVMHEISFARNPLNPRNIKGYKSLKKLVKEGGFDLIHCHQPVGGVMGRMVAHKFKLPCIYTAHGFHFFKGAPLKNRLIFKPIESYFSKYTNALITMNDEDYFNAKKMHAKKVYKINGIGVDLNKYKKDESLNIKEFRKSIGLNSEDFVVVAIGELNENKNHEIILKAINKISDENVKLIICGQGPLQNKYESFIIENKLEKRIKLLGFRKDINHILQASDVFVMPSLREGLPRSMMEAMTHGLPIVGSNIRGCTDLIGNNDGGYLCDPNCEEDFIVAFKKLKQDRQIFEKCSNRNKEFIKTFDLDNVLQQMTKIYEEL